MSFACNHRVIFAAALLTVTTVSVSSVRAEIPWQRSPEATFQSAKESGRPILVFVGAGWCHYCERMKEDTWSDPHVSEVVSRKYVSLQLDGDRDKRIVGKLELKGFPATLLYNSEGYFVAKKDGFMLPTQTLAWLESNTK